MLFTAYPPYIEKCKPLPSIGDSADDIVLLDTYFVPHPPKPLRRKIYLWKSADIQGIQHDLDEYSMSFEEISHTAWQGFPFKASVQDGLLWSRSSDSFLDNKYLSWVYGVGRKICHEGHWSASRGLPSDAEQWSRVADFPTTPYTNDRYYFFLHTFWFTTFDFHSSTCYYVIFFPLKSFYWSFKKSTLPATAVRFFTLTSNLHKVT